MSPPDDPTATLGAAARTDDLVLDAVGKVYGRHRALAGVSARFRPGEVGTVLGPNGAGKSTLLGILATLVAPTSGRVTWGDAALQPGSPVRARIGYVGHEPGLYLELSARQNLVLFASLFGLPAGGPGRSLVDELLERVDLAAALADREDAPVKTFSRGMRQRLALARALLHAPPILLFDEPGAALDPAGAAWLSRQIRLQREAGRIVIVVTHDLDAAAEVSDHVLILRRGRVVCDRQITQPPDAATLRGLYQEHTGGTA